MFEIPEEINKLLVYCQDPRYVAWELGKFNIYLERYDILETHPNLQINQPSIARVRSKTDEEVVKFIQNTTLKAARLFKTVRYKEKPPAGFYYNTAKNLLGLVHGNWIYIKSNNPEIRDAFYEVAKQLNEECGFSCTFDYDEYDYVFELKEFQHDDRKVLITYLYGLPDYPNVKLE